MTARGTGREGRTTAVRRLWPDLEHLLEGVLPREDVVGELLVRDALLPRRRREAPSAAPFVCGLYEVLYIVWREAVVERVSCEVLLVEAPLQCLCCWEGRRREGGGGGGGVRWVSMPTSQAGRGRQTIVVGLCASDADLVAADLIELYPEARVPVVRRKERHQGRGRSVRSREPIIIIGRRKPQSHGRPGGRCLRAPFAECGAGCKGGESRVQPPRGAGRDVEAECTGRRAARYS